MIAVEAVRLIQARVGSALISSPRPRSSALPARSSAPRFPRRRATLARRVVTAPQRTLLAVARPPRESVYRVRERSSGWLQFSGDTRSATSSRAASASCVSPASARISATGWPTLRSCSVTESGQPDSVVTGEPFYGTNSTTTLPASPSWRCGARSQRTRCWSRTCVRSCPRPQRV